MGQRIGARKGGKRRRAGDGQLRIADRDLRNEIGAGDADLGSALLVGNHRNRRHFGAGARGSGQRDQRNDRPGNRELAVIILDIAAMREEHRGDLRQIDRAAAADADHHVRREIACRGDAALDRFHRKIGNRAVEHPRLDAVGGEIGEHVGEFALGGLALIGAQYRAPPDRRGGRAERGALLAPEQNIARQPQCAEHGEGLAHLVPPPTVLRNAMTSARSCASVTGVAIILVPGTIFPGPARNRDSVASSHLMCAARIAGE